VGITTERDSKEPDSRRRGESAAGEEEPLVEENGLKERHAEARRRVKGIEDAVGMVLRNTSANGPTISWQRTTSRAGKAQPARR
jgi:hypothetical protein